MSRLYNTKNKNPVVIRSISPTLGTKKTEEFKKKLKNKSRDKKMGGGMMGRRFGMKKGSKFPDLTGDGKVTFADILKGRGVINGKKKKTKKKII